MAWKNDNHDSEEVMFAVKSWLYPSQHTQQQ